MTHQKRSRLWRVLSLLLITTLFMSVQPGSAFAEGAKQEEPEIIYVVVREDPTISIEYDGVIQSLQNEQGQPVIPITFMGTTYLPVRAISNILGNDVEWVGETRTIRLIP